MSDEVTATYISSVQKWCEYIYINPLRKKLPGNYYYLKNIIENDVQENLYSKTHESAL